ncbi:MAG: hypothetical protein WC812_04025 [Candidatus Pacearchaeota archaeon]
MNKKKIFLIVELLIFLIMFSLTILELFNFELFRKIFLLLVEYISWFVSFSFGYLVSEIFKDSTISLISKFSKKRDKSGKKEGDVFLGFLIIIIFVAIGISYFKDFISNIFTNFFIYFHILFMQSIILLYLFYKVKYDYEISVKVFLINEFVVLINILIILLFT